MIGASGPLAGEECHELRGLGGRHSPDHRARDVVASRRCVQRSEFVRETWETVLVPTWIAPGRRPLRTPFGAETTVRRDASSARLEITMSAIPAAAAGDSARLAPAARSGSAFSADRFQTTNGSPARWRFVAMATPIFPRPRNATGVLSGAVIVIER
jgi:hypothetical protein